MKIRLRAEHKPDGVLLARLETEYHAESVRLYFLEIGIAADSISSCEPGDHRIILPGMTTEVFLRIVRGANIELI
jgi:hypothetical protein